MTAKPFPVLTYFFLVIAFFSCEMETFPPSNDMLWYEQPAEEWEQALPLGNGRLGIMVFGKPSNERIQLNDDSLWPADLGWDEPAGTPEDLEAIRQLLFDGKNKEADAMFVDKFSRKKVVRSHQTLGDLFIDFDHQNITDYKRSLDLGNALVNVSYKSNGHLVKQEAFVSHPHQFIVLTFTSEAPEGLNGKIRLSRPKDDGQPTATTKVKSDGSLVMEGIITQREGYFDSQPTPILDGVQFETRLKIHQESGEVNAGKDFLELVKVKKATFYIASNSSFYQEDYAAQNEKELAILSSMSFQDIKLLHVKDFQNQYQKLELELGGRAMDSLATDKRLARIKEGRTDNGLEQLLFQYGRYLLISSSRPGTNPANLQGLWNQHINAPWNADYHLNINLQMNYWLADITGLGELNRPLFRYIDRLVENGKKTAMKNFGCRGAFIPHATDLWAPTWLRAPTAYWGCSIGAGGWLMQHYWQHFEFTRDTAFLRDRAFPAIEAVAQFYSDWLIEDPRDNTLISAPSTSPENRFINESDEPVATCLGSAMDQQIIAEVFDNFLQGADILEIDNELTKTIQQQKLKLRPGFVLGADGRILEWDREYPEYEPGHRHMSHLYGFHPGVSITKAQTPDIFKAVKTTLDFRLDNGGAGTGWSRAWLINCSARLLDGEMAHEHIQLLFKKSMLDNLFDSHPPFQIDGNFGYTAGVAEMLVQSHEGNMIRVLPALPKAWATGHVKGINARGGLSLDIYWENSALTKVVFHPHFDSDIQLIYGDRSTPISLKSGEEYVFQG